jgi:hypothetical protein
MPARENKFPAILTSASLVALKKRLIFIGTAFPA